MRGARLGHPAHRDGGRTHRVPPARPRRPPASRAATSNTSTHHHPGHPDQQRDHTPASAPTSAPTAASRTRPPPRPRGARGTGARAAHGCPGRRRQLRRAARRHPVGHRVRARHPRRLAGPVRRQPRGDRPRPRASSAPAPSWPCPAAQRRPGTRSRPATPSRASPPRSPSPAAGPPCTRPTARAIGPDPDAIRAGTVLAIPCPAPSASHAAAPGVDADQGTSLSAATGRRPPANGAGTSASPAGWPSAAAAGPSASAGRSSGHRPGCRGGWRSCWWRPGCSSRPRS